VTPAKPVLQSYQQVTNGICNHTNPFTNVLRVARCRSSTRWQRIRTIYQLDFRTPGISPFRLNDRKQILHIRNRRKNPRTRPQISHRW